MGWGWGGFEPVIQAHNTRPMWFGPCEMERSNLSMDLLHYGINNMLHIAQEVYNARRNVAYS